MVIGNHILINGDCLEVMPTIESGSVDMILCDLPYGTTQNKWDSVIPFAALWTEYKRIIKSNGVIVLTAQPPFDKLLGASNIEWLKYEWIWEKEQGTGHLNAKKQPLKSHENVLVFYKTLPTYNPQMVGCEMRTVKRNGLKAKTSNYGNFIELAESTYLGRYPKSILRFNKEVGLHPTQKPVALFEYLIKTYTNEGETVLDNCAGSFTTAVACENTGRKSICIEKEEKYFNIGVERVRNIQPTLFKKAV